MKHAEQAPASLTEDQVSAWRTFYMGQLAERRKAMGLSQQDLAARAGVTRMTVQRAETESNVSFDTFLQLAAALNLVPALTAGPGEENALREQAYVPPQNMVHRGTQHLRTRHNLDFSDRKREKALADAWEKANEHKSTGLEPLMHTLAPGATQPMATAAATAIQWLGSDIGFDFLKKALQKAGYDVIKK